MEFHWLNRAGNGKLIVFALGWAADYRVVEHIRLPGWDVLAVYNYGESIGSPVEFISDPEGYSVRCLFAWSFGVWAAEQIFRNTTFDYAVALNGTPFPVNERYGIEPRRMSVTIRGLASGGTETFNCRAYGEHYDRFKDLLSPRRPERNITELEFLAAKSQKPYEPAIEWSKAIVGTEDVIFPPENMLRFWGSRAEALPLPHYPFADGELIVKELGCR